MAEPAAISQRRLAAILVALLLIVAPILWLGWGWHAAAVVEASNAALSAQLLALRQRLLLLRTGPESTGALSDAAAVYLPGETAAITGAALQRLVVDTIEAAGGRLTESEVSPPSAAEEEPGRIDLRVSFDTEIVGLQRILHALESRLPILFVRALNVRSAETGEVGPEVSPPLRVVLSVGGYREVEK